MKKLINPAQEINIEGKELISINIKTKIKDNDIIVYAHNINYKRTGKWLKGSKKMVEYFQKLEPEMLNFHSISILK